MGNKCCGREHKIERIESTNPALQAIREAQRKYFNSHIESDLDDSDNDEDREDSGDGALYGSESSLINGEDNSLDNAAGDSVIVAETVSTLRTSDNMSIDHSSSAIMGNDNLNNNNKDVSGTPSTPAATTNEDINVKTNDAKAKTAVVKRRKKAKYIRLSKRGDFFSIFNTEDKKARSVDPKLYQYPFENIVFEGGGNKGLAYCGAVRLLEEINVWPQIKRLAGTSAGAMTAALLAIGYNSHDLEQFFSLNLNNIFLDHKFGYLSLLPNLLTSYGWNPGKRIYKWFGQKIQEKTGNMDTTFKEVYDMCNRELCIVVTNLNQMTTLYCHPKTTPDMPVRLAVRMSMSIPGLFQAVKHTLHGQTDIFVDGGVLCNYPIHCFDGWWLSMKPEDNFLEKLQPLEDIPRLLERSERFGTYNEKTLGMQLYSDNEQDLLKYQLENLRHGVQLQELPNTKLAREKIRKKKLQLKTDREHRRLVKAMNAFLWALNKHNTDRNDTIDRQELEAALNDEMLFPRKRRLILFGDVDSDVILEYLDRDQNGQISYNELLSFMEETGINMQNRFLGYQRRNIKSFPSFMETLQATLLTNVKRVYVEERDLKRTVGINTGHVGTSDFVLEDADVDFVLERGRRSLEAFLKYYVASNHLKKKPEFKRYDDLRKDSKCSLVSSSSVQSFESGSSLPAITIPVPSVLSHVRSPLAGDPLLKDAEMIHNSNKQQDKPPSSLSPTSKNAVSRSKSGSSGKSVSISDKIEVIERKLSSNDYMKDENDSDGDDQNNEVSESVFLLGNQTEYSHKVNYSKENITTKNISTSPANSSVHTPFTGLHRQKETDLTSPNGNKYITKENIKLTGMHLPSVSDVQVDHGEPESPTTPLIPDIESQDAIELQALQNGNIIMFSLEGQPHDEPVNGSSNC